MAIDSTLPVRRAMMTRMKADAALLALVPAVSIHPQSPPAALAWPFVKYGPSSGVPIGGTCIDGHEVTVSVHGFSKGRREGGALVETAEDHAARIGAAIAASLDKSKFNLPVGIARARWIGSQLLQDGEEAGAYHTVQRFRVRVMS